MGDYNYGSNNATVEAGNGIGNQIYGPVSATAVQSVGSDHFGFGGGSGDTNLGLNGATNVSGNGIGNQIFGGSSATAHQDVGSDHFGWSPLGGDVNMGQNSALNTSANGIGNQVFGPVSATADQHVGSDHSGYGLPYFGGGVPGVGDINIGVNNAMNISGNGAFNTLGPTSADAHQDIGSTHGVHWFPL